MRLLVLVASGCVAACGGAAATARSAASPGGRGIATSTSTSTSTPTATSTPTPFADASPPPTWETIFTRYFAPGTEGACGRASCHARDMADADSAYRWLSARGYIAGSASALVRSNSCLRWFGGNMPPKGSPNESAARDLTAWAAAGAQQD